ncbi:hypothetical protein Fmac_027386 [Flemingia macrophylla]|uniref:Uncharacterized protein n=1 Tax=Flemingia macrophylla TaxID=520843 RepID=A0ABD1LHJ1_9FABA
MVVLVCLELLIERLGSSSSKQRLNGGVALCNFDGVCQALDYKGSISYGSSTYGINNWCHSPPGIQQFYLGRTQMAFVCFLAFVLALKTFLFGWFEDESSQGDPEEFKKTFFSDRLINLSEKPHKKMYKTRLRGCFDTT